jgi:hypothetical protein
MLLPYFGRFIRVWAQLWVSLRALRGVRSFQDSSDSFHVNRYPTRASPLPCSSGQKEGAMMPCHEAQVNHRTDGWVEGHSFGHIVNMTESDLWPHCLRSTRHVIVQGDQIMMMLTKVLQMASRVERLLSCLMSYVPVRNGYTMRGELSHNELSKGSMDSSP